MQSFTFELAKGFLFFLPEVAILAACLYYFFRQKSNDSILLSLGALIGTCVSGFYRILLPIIQYSQGYDFFGGMFIYTVIGFISFAGAACFAIGLFMLVIKQLKKNNGF